MDENIVEFEEFGIKVDLREIENMSKEDLEKCLEKIKKLQEKIQNKRG